MWKEKLVAYFNIRIIPASEGRDWGRGNSFDDTLTAIRNHDNEAKQGSIGAG
jgi:hypothetical protein